MNGYGSSSVHDGYRCRFCDEKIDGWVDSVNHLTSHHAGEISGTASAGTIVDRHMDEVREVTR